MNRLVKQIVYGFFYAMAVLPLWFLYCLSDAAYVFVYHIGRYRRKLVRKNLVNAFPDKTLKEITTIEKDFYHHFCDSFFESIKVLNFSESRMKRHFVFKNDELLEYFLDDGRPVMLFLAHYGNWEWASSIALWVEPEEDRVVGHVYRPLKNKAFDYLYIRMREKFHSAGFVKNNVYRDIVKIQKAGKNWLLCFVSDQKPSPNDINNRMTFLNQDTAILTGSAKIAKHTGAAVCFLEVTKLKRSYYEGKIKLIADNPAELTEYEITERYMQFVEKSVLKNPAYYLWTHNRWKYSRNNQQQSTL
jgi:KDO2-lipid IV(A) lauroyltransferase